MQSIPYAKKSDKSAHARNITLTTFGGLGAVNLQGYEIKVTNVYVVL